MTETKNRKPFFKSDRSRVVAIAVAAVTIIGGTFGVQAVANSKTAQHLTLAASDTGAYQGFTHQARWGHHGRGFGHRLSDMTDAEIEKLASRMVRHLGIEIEATAEQEAKLVALATALAKEMKPVREEFRDAGKELHKLFTAPSIDRTAIEKVRAERIAAADRISKEVTNALVEAAEVMTPEQRKLLEERIEHFRGMRGHRRGWHRG